MGAMKSPLVIYKKGEKAIAFICFVVNHIFLGTNTNMKESISLTSYIFSLGADESASISSIFVSNPCFIIIIAKYSQKLPIPSLIKPLQTSVWVKVPGIPAGSSL
jgi:hypothetical protein